jgi:hypothetical protein
MNSHAAPVTVESSTCSEAVLIKVTPAQKRFLVMQSRRELRTVANLVRSWIVEHMSGE